MTLVATSAKASSSSGGLSTLYDSGALGAPAASIDTGAGGIAVTATVLIISARLRSTTVASDDQLVITLNNDTGAHYYASILNSSGGSASQSGGGAPSAPLASFKVPAASAVAALFGHVQMVVPFYSDAIASKTILGQWGYVIADGSNFQQGEGMVLWNQTAQISRLKITLQSGANFVANSQLLIKGY